MTTLSDDEFRFLVRRAGLSMSDDELQQLRTFYDAFEERLKPLYEADLSEEEVSGIFLPRASGLPNASGEVTP